MCKWNKATHTSHKDLALCQDRYPMGTCYNTVKSLDLRREPQTLDRTVYTKWDQCRTASKGFHTSSINTQHHRSTLMGIESNKDFLTWKMRSRWFSLCRKRSRMSGCPCMLHSWRGSSGWSKFYRKLRSQLQSCCKWIQNWKNHNCTDPSLDYLSPTV